MTEIHSANIFLSRTAIAMWILCRIPFSHLKMFQTATLRKWKTRDVASKLIKIIGLGLKIRKSPIFRGQSGLIRNPF